MKSLILIVLALFMISCATSDWEKEEDLSSSIRDKIEAKYPPGTNFKVKINWQGRKKAWKVMYSGSKKFMLHKGEILTVWKIRNDRILLKTITGFKVPIKFGQYNDIESFEEILFTYFELK